MAGESRPWQRLMLGAGLFLMVWGGKLAVIDRWGSDLPWWDDWSGIAANLLIPHQRGELTAADFFTPHNEHRIACTRALDLVLVMLNGQWDARLECVVNAAIHAGIVVFAFFVGRTLLLASRAAQVAWFVALTALTAPPVVWENIMRGFDSQHYFVIGFSLAAMVGLLARPAGSRAWWAAAMSAVIALFTMGSGLVAAAAVLVTLLVTTPRQDWWARHRWTLLVCLLVSVAGIALRHEVPAHAAHRAQNVKEFTIAFWHHLQWPLVHHAWFGCFSWLPWAAFAWRAIRRDSTLRAGERVIVAVGLWALVHYAAMAWMRGHMQPWPPTRGLENVVVGLAVNFIALLLLLQRPRASWWQLTKAWVPAVVGVAVAIHGWTLVIRENLTYVLPKLAAAPARLAERNTRAFLVTGDRAWLKPGEIPFPNPDFYAAVLSRPELQPLLPASVRRPLMLKGQAEPPESFVPGGVPPEVAHPAALPVIGSYAAEKLATVGQWRSEMLAPGEHGFWQFDVAGSLMARDMVVALTTADGATVTELPTAGASAAVWSTIVVRRPARAVTLEVRDQSSHAWAAVSGPVEMAAGSWNVRQVAGWGLGLAIAGAICAAAGGLAVALARRPTKQIPTV